jgi:H+/Cl- antiporter ClcA
MLSTIAQNLAQILFAALALVLVYHHIGYPVLLRVLARRARARGVQAPVAPLNRTDGDLPTVTLIVPAHNGQW